MGVAQLSKKLWVEKLHVRDLYIPSLYGTTIFSMFSNVQQSIILCLKRRLNNKEEEKKKETTQNTNKRNTLPNRLTFLNLFSKELR